MKEPELADHSIFVPSDIEFARRVSANMTRFALVHGFALSLMYRCRRCRAPFAITRAGVENVMRFIPHIKAFCDTPDGFELEGVLMMRPTEGERLSFVSDDRLVAIVQGKLIPAFEPILKMVVAQMPAIRTVMRPDGWFCLVSDAGTHSFEERVIKATAMVLEARNAVV